MTPVLMSSPSISVVCPTRTPATSVIAFSGPAGSDPTTMPRSRALARPLSVTQQIISAPARPGSEPSLHAL